MRRPGVLSALYPRHAAAIAALLIVGWAFAYAFSEETPVGRVEGTVRIQDTDRPLVGADITLQPINAKGERVQRMRYAVSGEGGRFTFAHVPAGTYYLSADSRAHSVSDQYLSVDEGGTTQLHLALKRSEPDLALQQHQRVFGTREKASLAVRGYVDGKKPAGQDTLSLRIYRTRLSRVLQNRETAEALESVGRGWDPAPRLPAELLKPKSGPAPQPVLARDVRITEDDREGFFYQKLDFGKLESGLYLVDIRHQSDTVCAWALVTDTALVIKKAKRQVIAFAVDMRAGSPVPGSVVRAYREGKIIAQSQTDARGLAELRLPEENANEENGPSDSTRLTLVALRGPDEAVVEQDIYREEGDGPFRLHAYTDRPIYRPGQRIYFKGIARRIVAPPTDSGLKAIESQTSTTQHRTPSAYTIPTGEPIQVEIRDPSGERILEKRLVANQYGSFFGAADLDPEAATGVYSLIMTARGQKQTHDFTVASYQKPEFKVTVTPEQKRYTQGETVTMTVSGEYYFGAPVAGAKVKYSIYHAPDWAAEYADEEDEEDEADSAESPPDYYHGGSYYGAVVTDGETTLDADGKAVITFRADAPPDTEGPQAQQYTVSVTVTESAEREVYADGRVTVTAGDFKLLVKPEGYVAAPGQPTPVLLTAADYDDKPLPNVPITLEIGYQEWKRNEEGEYKYRYQTVGTQKIVTGPDGKVSVSVTPPRAGELLLKAHTTDAKGRAILGRAGLWAAGEEGGDLDTEYADLSLLTNKRRYHAGDTARVLVNAVRTGQTVLLTIEGDRVYRSQTLKLTKKSSVVRVPILAEYGPNVFLVACYVRDKKFARSEAPLRVVLPQRELKITVRADKTPVLTPGEKITYSILTTDAQGRPTPCEFSMGVVDEAIYALREDDPNALRDAFYPRRYNAVQTAYSFAIQYLGDADKAEPQIAARKKFPDTAFWEPTLHTDAQGRATVSFSLPDSLTTWRATVIGQTQDTRLGRAVEKVIVAKDFFVRVEKPRFLTQHDRSQIMALVHNDTGATQTALVRLRAANLTVSGDPTQTLTLEPGKVGQAVWNVAADGYGEAKLRVTAWTPQAPSGPQYTDGVETALPIRPHGREDLVAFAGELTAANPETEIVRLDPAAIPGASRLTIRITPSVATAMAGALDYLIGYPYGCTEQTMSRFLPDLLVQRAMRLHGLARVPQAAELPRMVRSGLLRLYRFQHRETGGWGWWEHDSDDAWMTAYVLYGLAVAKAEGYPVNESVLANGRKAARQMAPGVKSNDRAFLLYALALAGETQGARAERPKLNLKLMGPEALAYVVLLDRLLGASTSEALPLLERRAVSDGGMLHWDWESGLPADYRAYSGDAQTATAAALRALLAVNRNDPRISAIVRWLMFKRTGEYWSSTRDTSVVLAALCDYLAAQGTASPGGQVQIRLNGRVVQSYTLTADLRQEKELVLRVPAAELRPGKNDITLERLGGTSSIFYSVQLRQTIASEDLPALSTAKIGVQREFLRVLPKQAGQASWTLQTEPTNNRLQQGDRVRVRLTLTVPKDLAYVLIEDPFPSGCEVTERGTAEEVVEWGYWWSSVDVRDDRIAFFARDLTKGTHVIEYNLRAQTPGTYHTLPTLLQAMYAPETRAESAETRVEVR